MRGSASGSCLARCALVLGLSLSVGCSGGTGTNAAGVGGADNGSELPLPYAVTVESFSPGEAAGYNEDKLPDIVLGPPQGKGIGAGSLDVLSLGGDGEIVLGFGDQVLTDGPGPDFVVFENPFWPNEDKSQAFVELGEVSVSDDGETWRVFACDTEGDGEGNYPGCAGVNPTLKYDAGELVPLDPAQTGGDAFDLADLAVTRARYVKLKDLRTLEPAGTSGGFDLDAVGVVNRE